VVDVDDVDIKNRYGNKETTTKKRVEKLAKKQGAGC
jgi:hypothetical protein